MNIIGLHRLLTDLFDREVFFNGRERKKQKSEKQTIEMIRRKSADYMEPRDEEFV